MLFHTWLLLQTLKRRDREVRHSATKFFHQFSWDLLVQTLVQPLPVPGGARVDGDMTLLVVAEFNKHFILAIEIDDLFTNVSLKISYDSSADIE